MKKIFTLAVLLLMLSYGFLYSQDNKKIVLNELWGSGKYVSASVDDNTPMNSDEHYTILENSFQINEYEYKSGKKTRTIVNFYDVFKDAGLKVKSIDSFEFSEDENFLLISTETESIYRHSSASKYYMYDIRQKKLVSISDNKVRLASFSPDASMVAYVFDNNIFIKDLITSDVKQLTTDGKYNEIINGTTDWVYEEEFGFTQAYFWSADGKNLAYYRFDETHVKEFSMTMYGKLYPEEYRYKYPKAGEENAHVTIHIYNIVSGKNIPVDIGNEKDQYIPRIKWSKDPSILFVYRMNRLQNHLEILSTNATDGTTKRIYEEKNKHYIDINDNLIFTDDGKYFILTSEQNGYNHIYRFDMQGKLFNQVTNGQWEVVEIIAYNAKDNLIYYTSNQDSPLNKHVYAIETNGANSLKLTTDNGHNNPKFSKKFKYFINEFSDINTPSVYTVCNGKNGKPVRTIEENATLIKTLDMLDVGKAEFFSFNNAENVELKGWMIKPHDFNPQNKYPVLFYVYGGPGVQTVENKWGRHNYLWLQMLTQKGYIVVSVDNRGTPGRGEAFKKSTYGQLGKHETNDQIDAAKYLATLPYIDKERIGMFGWSYGGYLTLLCMTKGAEYFKTGIAVAPVTNWRFYDSIYTERFMGLPKDNAEGYDDNSPINHAKKLKGKLLIVHGSADDNVHYQNTMEMTNALVNANKQFDMHIYTNKNHGIYGGYTRLHLFEKMTDYIINNL